MSVLEAADLGKEVFMFHACFYRFSREKTKLTTVTIIVINEIYLFAVTLASIS